MEVQQQIDKQKELSQNQLVKYEQVNDVLAQSDEIAAKAKQIEAETFQLTQQLEEADKRAEQDFKIYEKHQQEGVLEGFEIFVGKVKNFAREN